MIANVFAYRYNKVPKYRNDKELLEYCKLKDLIAEEWVNEHCFGYGIIAVCLSNDKYMWSHWIK